MQVDSLPRMGFDICDRGQKDNCLPLDFWSWRTIVEIVRRAGVLPEDTVNKLHTPFCGYGLDREQALRIADVIESQVLPLLGPDDLIRIDGSLKNDPPVGDLGGPTGWTWYRTSRGVLLSFIEFCRGCSGFNVN